MNGDENAEAVEPEPGSVENGAVTLADAQDAAQADAGKQMMDEYALDAPPGQEDGKEAEAGVEEVPFALEFSEGVRLDDGLVQLGTRHAKELGLEGKAAGAFMERVLSGLQAAEYAGMVESDAALKLDWGERYAVNKAAVKQGLEHLRVKAGLSQQDMRVLASPKGFRLGYALLEAAGLVDSPAAGVGDSSQPASVNYAREVASNPNHPDYAAYHDVSHVDYRRVNAAVNRALGMV